MLQTAVASLQSPDSDTQRKIGVNVLTGRVLFVPETAIGSLQSPDSDTDWIIGLNVVTEWGFVCAADSGCFFNVTEHLILSG